VLRDTCCVTMIFDERLILNDDSQADIIGDEHLVRYRLAAKLVPGLKVLDIACGSGYGANILAEAGAAQVVAVDVNSEAVAAAQKKYTRDNLVYKIGNAEEIKEADESFDLVASFETIEHLKNPEKYLAELKRVLKKEGIALISTPNIEVFGQKNPFHLHEFTKSEFKEMIGKYFSGQIILEQSNGLASFIKIAGAAADKIDFSNSGAPLYFIAVCGQAEIVAENLFKENFASINPLALERRQNNPAVKLVDKIYSLLIKIPGVKMLRQNLAKRILPRR
jgi:2-polyprenyl-3-methyl-5-hydroxy-6-metoxy-1,4-benzoquinol methylase